MFLKPSNTKTMTSEFTAWCNYYCQLTMLLSEYEEYFQNLLDNAPLYCGQARLSEVDAIISYYRSVQTEKAKMDKRVDDLREAERTILDIMRHFEIPPGTVFNGEIPGELRYALWADERDALHVSKTEDIAAEDDDANIMVIKFSGQGRDGD